MLLSEHRRELLLRGGRTTKVRLDGEETSWRKNHGWTVNGRRRVGEEDEHERFLGVGFRLYDLGFLEI